MLGDLVVREEGYLVEGPRAVGLAGTSRDARRMIRHEGILVRVVIGAGGGPSLEQLIFRTRPEVLQDSVGSEGVVVGQPRADCKLISASRRSEKNRVLRVGLIDVRVAAIECQFGAGALVSGARERMGVFAQQRPAFVVRYVGGESPGAQ